MEMQFKNEIKKLADIVVWADNLITAAGFDVEKYKNDAASAYCHVKAHELWKIKTVVLEAIDRHTAYTNALNKDIADKAAKIDLLEKEIEGRKEGYVALKTQMDVALANKDEKAKELINISTKEISELKKELADCKVKIRHQKENLDGINKTLGIRTKENERLIAVKNNQEKEIEAHEAENARLSEKIKNMHDTITELTHDIDNYKSWNADLHRDIKSEINGKNDLVDAYEKKYDEFEKKIAELEKQNNYLTKELEETCRTKEADLKNHNKRDMTLVDELAKKNDEIKELKGSIEYYKNQERIRTDQLRATESKVEELHGSINRLTLNCRAKNTEIARLAKEHSDIRHKLAKRTAELEFNGEDDHGRAGFKKYIEWLIEEEERAVPERFKERLNEEITTIFEKKEETEVKGVGRTSSGRYPWGAKVNDIPCGEDSIE